MKSGQQYNDATRAAAVLEAERVGSERAAAKLGMTGRSIRRWASDPAVSALVLKTREEMADDIRVAEALAWDLLIERLRNGDIASRDLVVIAGVATDKAQLLTGAATARNENRDITGSLSDSDVRDALHTAAELARAGVRASETPEGTPEG